jgi:quinol monooxygenase YgiN
LSVIVAGTIRAPIDKLEALRVHMAAMIAATRAEDGCIDYTYALDVADEGLIRVFEIWRDRAALDAHFKTAHMAAWRAAWPGLGVSDRRIVAYEIASEQSL